MSRCYFDVFTRTNIVKFEQSRLEFICLSVNLIQNTVNAFTKRCVQIWIKMRVAYTFKTTRIVFVHPLTRFLEKQ